MFDLIWFYLPQLVCFSLGSKTPATLLDPRLENRNIVYPLYIWKQTTFSSILFYSLDIIPSCILETHNHPTFSANGFLKNKRKTMLQRLHTGCNRPVYNGTHPISSFWYWILYFIYLYGHMERTMWLPLNLFILCQFS